MVFHSSSILLIITILSSVGCTTTRDSRQFDERNRPDVNVDIKNERYGVQYGKGSYEHRSGSNEIELGDSRSLLGVVRIKNSEWGNDVRWSNRDIAIRF